MIARLRVLSAAVDRAVIAVCIGCFVIMLAISFIGFFYQVITGAALSWTYSLARLFVPWIAMLSITVAFRRGEHVAMALLLEYLPPRVATIVSYANLAIIGLLALLLVWFGWQFFITTTHYNMVSDQIQIHNRFVAACIPVTGLILIVHLVCGLHLLDLAAPEAEVEELLRESEAAEAEARP
jgi:TRAP-type C4-dicarboxylate transport system permease small subunit